MPATTRAERGKRSLPMATLLATVALLFAWTYFTGGKDDQAAPEALTTGTSDGSSRAGRPNTVVVSPPVTGSAAVAATRASASSPPATAGKPRVAQPAEHPYPEPNDRLQMPDWSRIFDPGGSLKDETNRHRARRSNGIPDHVDLYSGLRADFIQDNLSNGIATDMSALLVSGRLDQEVLYNGAVSPAHDLGNIYFLVARGVSGDLRYFLAIERLFTPADSWIEIEFNQQPVLLGAGTGWWPLLGERKDGDLLVRLALAGGRLSEVEIETWQGGAYTMLDQFNGSPGKGCRGSDHFIYCGGTPPIDHSGPGFELWDTQFRPVAPIRPNDFLQVGLEPARLIGPDTIFGGVLVRTPEDIALNGFYRPERAEPALASGHCGFAATSGRTACAVTTPDSRRTEEAGQPVSHGGQEHAAAGGGELK